MSFFGPVAEVTLAQRECHQNGWKNIPPDGLKKIHMGFQREFHPDRGKYANIPLTGYVLDAVMRQIKQSKAQKRTENNTCESTAQDARNVINNRIEVDEGHDLANPVPAINGTPVQYSNVENVRQSAKREIAEDQKIAQAKKDAVRKATLQRIADEKAAQQRNNGAAAQGQAEWTRTGERLAAEAAEKLKADKRKDAEMDDLAASLTALNEEAAREGLVKPQRRAYRRRMADVLGHKVQQNNKEGAQRNKMMNNQRMLNELNEAAALLVSAKADLVEGLDGHIKKAVELRISEARARLGKAVKEWATGYDHAVGSDMTKGESGNAEKDDASSRPDADDVPLGVRKAQREVLNTVVRKLYTENPTRVGFSFTEIWERIDAIRFLLRTEGGEKNINWPGGTAGLADKIHVVVDNRVSKKNALTEAFFDVLFQTSLPLPTAAEIRTGPRGGGQEFVWLPFAVAVPGEPKNMRIIERSRVKASFYRNYIVPGYKAARDELLKNPA